MMKPDDIPQDVWDAAIEAAGFEHCFADVVERIARANLAERERCALIAQETANEADGGEYYIASMIATSIRKGGG